LPADNVDLEEYWDTLRPKPLVKRIDDKPSKLGAVLELVCEKTLYDVHTSLGMYLQEVDFHNRRMIEDTVARGIRSLKTNWLKELEGKDLSGLIEFILQGQRLGGAEMTEFVHALPRSLLSRICASTLNTANGIHALMGVEAARRDHTISGYTVRREQDRIRVDFRTRPGDDVTFYLDEDFELIEERCRVSGELEI
jgi:hypothetical protein